MTDPRYPLAALAAAFLALLPAMVAHALPPPDAEVVLVRKDCAASWDPSVCVGSLADLEAWLATRSPADNPVEVNIGPGTWDDFTCNGEDNVALRGAGRESTVIASHSNDSAAFRVVDHCDNLNVSSLTIHGAYAGVDWGGRGRSTWSDTDILAGGEGFTGSSFSIGWYDTNVSPCTPVHYFFGSRVRALGAAIFNWGFVARCAEHWFFGGEVVATNEVDTTGGIQQTAVGVLATGNPTVFQAFGTAIRSLVGAATSADFMGAVPGMPAMQAVTVTDNGTFHAHGGILSAIATPSTTAASVVGVEATSGATLVHTPGSAFVVKPGAGGTATRLIDPGGIAESPFTWQPSASPPPVASLDGADTFVETDCDSSGNCNAAGTEPHLMIHAPTACGSSNPWFDAVTGSCRP